MVILAKPDESLEAHTNHVLNVLKSLKNVYSFLPSFCQNKEFWKEVFVAAVFHDFGKAAKGFQQMLHSIKDKKETWNYRHEYLSAGIVKSLKIAHLERGANLAILTHHKDLNYLISHISTINSPAGTQRFEEKKNEISSKEKEELIALIPRLMARSSETIGQEIRIPDCSQLDIKDPSDLIRFISKKYLDPVSVHEWRYHVSLKGMLTAADHLASAGYDGILKNAPITKYVQFKNLWEHQISIAAVLGSCFLCAPTGTGKTEASLLWVTNNSSSQEGTRILYVLPYTASINAIYKRFTGVFTNLGEPYAVSMVHYRSYYYLNSIVSSDEGQQLHLKADVANDLARKIFSPIKIITPYQILKSLFSSKGFEQRLTEIARGFIIFDEIHVYDIPLMGFLLETIRFLVERYEVKVLLMSATFPKSLQQLFREVLPAASDVNASINLRAKLARHRIFIHHRRVFDLIGEIRQDLIKGKKVLVVCNTVNQAQEMYKSLRKYVSPKKRALIHGRFILRDREIQEQRLDEKSLLIGTQAIEVSLNISYDVLYTEVAPIDALIQRFGRINRSAVKPPAESLKITPKPINICAIGGEFDHFIYSEDLTNKTLSELKKLHGKVLNENIITQMVENVYSGGYSPQDLKKLRSVQKKAQKVFKQCRPYFEEKVKFETLINGIQAIPLSYEQEYYTALMNNPIESVKYFLSLTKNRYLRYYRSGKIHYDHTNDVIFVNASYDSELGLLS